jgi:hypothetical protein
VLDGDYGNLFLEAYAAVAAGGAVHLKKPFVFIVGNLGARHRGSSAGNLDDVAHLRAKALQIHWREARNGTAYIFNACLRNAQCERTGWRSGFGLGHLAT